MVNTQITKWSNLQRDELKEEVLHAIMGQGMGGSTQYLLFTDAYFEKIGDEKTKNEVLNIIKEFAEDIGALPSSRAIYLLGELPILDKKETILRIIGLLNPIVEDILKGEGVPDSSADVFDYICELNKLIGRLNLFEGKLFLENQTAYLQYPMPEPITKEYYFYHLCARSAAESLRLLQNN